MRNHLDSNLLVFHPLVEEDEAEEEANTGGAFHSLRSFGSPGIS
jgi:hypothetical protein